jgi:hypothetical protein
VQLALQTLRERRRQIHHAVAAGAAGAVLEQRRQRLLGARQVRLDQIDVCVELLANHLGHILELGLDALVLDTQVVLGVELGILHIQHTRERLVVGERRRTRIDKEAIAIGRHAIVVERRCIAIIMRMLSIIVVIVVVVVAVA